MSTGAELTAEGFASICATIFETCFSRLFPLSLKCLLDLPEDEKKLLKDQAALTTPESLHVYFQMLLGGEEQIRRSSMPKIALEMLLLRMAQLPRLESIDAVLDNIPMIEQGVKRGTFSFGLHCFRKPTRFREKGLPPAFSPRCAAPLRFYCRFGAGSTVIRLY